MTVRELIAALSALPDTDKDRNVEVLPSRQGYTIKYISPMTSHSPKSDAKYCIWLC